MPTSPTDFEPRALSVRFTQEALVVTLLDGRILQVPLDWYPRLEKGTPAQRRRWILLGRGEGIHWPDLDEDLSVAGLLRGVPAPGARPRSRTNQATRRRTPRRR
jgi:hypothetical protein